MNQKSKGHSKIIIPFLLSIDILPNFSNALWPNNSGASSLSMTMASIFLRILSPIFTVLNLILVPADTFPVAS